MVCTVNHVTEDLQHIMLYFSKCDCCISMSKWKKREGSDGGGNSIYRMKREKGTEKQQVMKLCWLTCAVDTICNKQIKDDMFD